MEDSAVSCSVVIVAAGVGSRVGGDVPKPFVELRGVPLWAWSGRHFQKMGCVSEIIVVAALPYHDMIKETARVYGMDKLKCCVAGGKLRQDSVKNGVDVAVSELVMVHDGARPFPPDVKEIRSALAKVAEGEGVCGTFAVPITDTIRDVQKNCTVSREHLFAVQTPQIARREELCEALSYCANRGICVTDDVSALELRGKKVLCFPGDRRNMKVTYPVDFALADYFAVTLNVN